MYRKTEKSKPSRASSQPVDPSATLLKERSTSLGSPLPSPPLPADDLDFQDGNISELEHLSYGIGIGELIDDEGRMSPRSREEYRRALDATSPADTLRLRQRARSVSLKGQTNTEIRIEEKPHWESPKTTPRGYLLPIVAVVAVVIIFVLALANHISRNDISTVPVQGLLTEYFNVIGVSFEDEEVKENSRYLAPPEYKTHFLRALQIFSCKKPQTILFFTPNIRAAQNFLQRYSKLAFVGMPFSVVDGGIPSATDEVVSQFQKSNPSRCPSQILVVTTKAGLNEDFRNFLEPALDDTYPVLQVDTALYRSSAAVVVILVEFDRDNFDPVSWKGRLAEAWTARFVQRLRHVVGLEFPSV